MYSIEQIRRAGLAGEISNIDVEHLISVLTSPVVKFKGNTILINSFETYLYDEEAVYSLEGDFLFTTKEFCEKYNYDNTCEVCDDERTYMSEEFVGCAKPASECCGGCTSRVLVECECEDKKFKIWD